MRALFSKESIAFWKKLVEIQAGPHAIAAGFAIGLFVGFTPLFGFKTALTLLFATILRTNPIAAIIGVTLHDLFLPFLPASLLLEYDIGYWLMSHPHHLPPKLHLGDLELQELLHWTTFFREGLPLLIGSLVLGAPISLASYFLLKKWIVHHRRKKAHHHENKNPVS
jgi:uncharacterized protein (DUF2062 family)